MSKEVNTYKVYATLNGKEYIIGNVTYPDGSNRFELFEDKTQGVIFRNIEQANHAISKHKTTRQDQKVDEYKIVTVLL